MRKLEVRGGLGVVLGDSGRVLGDFCRIWGVRGAQGALWAPQPIYEALGLVTHALSFVLPPLALLVCMSASQTLVLIVLRKVQRSLL